MNMLTAEECAYAAKVIRGQVAPPNVGTKAGDRLDAVLQKVANYLMTPHELVTEQENIKLDYPLYLEREDTRYHCPDGAEFFMDEHGIQWVKFSPSNGYNPGKEHIWRTENVTVIVDPLPRNLVSS
jgi:hypothetical protein